VSSLAVSPPVVKAKSLSCPNCGGPVELRGFAHTLSVVCPSCHSILDASTPTLTLVQRVQEAQRIQPMIPLGSRGKLENTVYEVIGFQIRDIVGEPGEGWSEYLLFNPYKGFRYISEYRNHWNFIRVLAALPEPTKSRGKYAIRMLGQTYTHFDHADAVTSSVLGEFPWRVKVGEMAQVDDYVSPPYMLSSEATPGEVVWSLGEYYTCAQIWRAFQLPDRVPRASGVFANQPSPYAGRTASAWRLWLWLMIALFGITLVMGFTSTNKEVFRHSYSFTPGAAGEPSFVTDPFDLQGRPDNIQLEINTNLNNNWAYFNFALINQDSGHGYDFGREVSYYYGTDSDGSWSEGKSRDSVILPNVSPGRYYLRVEPEMDATATPMQYELVVRRGVPVWIWIWLAALLLLIPPIFIKIRSTAFESKRWRESDYPPSSSSSRGGD